MMSVHVITMTLMSELQVNEEFVSVFQTTRGTLAGLVVAVLSLAVVSRQRGRGGR